MWPWFDSWLSSPTKQNTVSQFELIMLTSKRIVCAFYSLGLSKGKFAGRAGTWTCDLRNKMPAVYQLGSSPNFGSVPKRGRVYCSQRREQTGTSQSQNSHKRDLHMIVPTSLLFIYSLFKQYSLFWSCASIFCIWFRDEILQTFGWIQIFFMLAWWSKSDNICFHI